MPKPILWRRAPAIWVPTPDGTMVSVDTDAPRFVREADYTDTVEAYETDLRQARTNEADARRSAIEVSQREARWMMIEQRLRTTIAARSPNYGPACDCIKCVMARELLAILNSDPPVGDGFRSEQGVSFNSIDPTSELGKLAALQLAADMVK